MLSVNIQARDINLKDIRKEHLPHIMSWYNKTEDFKYATGVYVPLSLEELNRRYREIILCNNEFFTGIYLNSGIMIGIIKGNVQYQNKNAVWLSSIVIDYIYQNKGYGRMAVELLFKHLKAKTQAISVYLSVVEENGKGRLFWIRQKFRVLKKMEKHLGIQRNKHNIIIMYKRI